MWVEISVNEINALIDYHKKEINHEKMMLELAFIGLTKKGTDEQQNILKESIDKLTDRIEEHKRRISELKYCKKIQMKEDAM